MHKHCFRFLLGVKKAPRENEDNDYAKFLGDKQGVLWYVMVFSGVVNCPHVFKKYDHDGLYSSRCLKEPVEARHAGDILTDRD